MTDSKKFRIALSADAFNADGSSVFRDMGLDVLDAQPHIEYWAIDEVLSPMTTAQTKNANGLLVLTPATSAETLAAADDLLAVARYGVGYDNVDVAACTQNDVLLIIAAGAVDRSVAEATIGWMIALTHHMRVKDQLLRQGRWTERNGYMGRELRDRTFGAVGLGGIARETIRLLGVFGMEKPMAFDPFVDAAAAAELGVELVGLDELMGRADFVSIHCPLNEHTRNLIGAEQIALMKEDAYLINTARGGIVEEDALFAALSEKRIAGAALDCFVGEPIDTPHRFGTLENVMLAPHSVAWTDELFRDIGQTVCQAMVDLSLGKLPAKGIINPEVLEKESFQAKWRRLRQ
jgi:phosphoglycerate dehydrogenase-like enzyme